VENSQTLADRKDEVVEEGMAASSRSSRNEPYVDLLNVSQKI